MNTIFQHEALRHEGLGVIISGDANITGNGIEMPIVIRLGYPIKIEFDVDIHGEAIRMRIIRL